MSSVSVFSGRSAFDDFLQANVREQETGVSLTVLSLLARNNVDPWDEAARYARLPIAEAAMNLADLIAAALGDSLKNLDTDLMAIKLLTLLPQATTVRWQSRAGHSSAGLLERFKQAAWNWSRNGRR